MSNHSFAKPITLRPAFEADKAQILALLPYLAEFSIPPRRQAEHLWASDGSMAETILSNDTASSFIDVAADADDRVLGMIMVSLREEMLSHEPSAHLEAIVVDPRARGVGLGKQLMEHCEQRVRSLGAQSLTLHVFARNERARALYAGQEFDEELIRAIKWLD